MKGEQISSVVKNNETQAFYCLYIKLLVMLIKLQRKYELEKPVSCQVRSFDDKIKIKHHRGDPHMPVLSLNGYCFYEQGNGE